MNCRVPHEYRYALDAIGTISGQQGHPFVLLNLPELEEEMSLRGFGGEVPSLTASAIWIEPIRHSINEDLLEITSRLCNEGLLSIVASLPLSRLLPDNTCWTRSAIGTRLTGSGELTQSIAQHGFTIQQIFGIHTARSIGLNGLGRIMERVGRNDMADRFLARSKELYCSDQLDRQFSTVALICARKTGLRR